MSSYDDYKNTLKYAVMNKLSTETSGTQVKTMIWIILTLILLSCCTFSIYNNFNIDKIFFSSFNISILLSTNFLTIVAVILAMMYGFNVVSRDPTIINKYLPTSSPITNVGGIPAAMPTVIPTAPNSSSFFNSFGGGFSSVASTPLDN